MRLFELHKISVRGNVPQKLPNYIQLNGSFNQSAISVYTKVVGSGKNKYVLTITDITLPSSFTLPKFTVYKENFFTKIGELFGSKDIKTGDEQFDKLYRLKADDESQALQFFSNQLIDAFLNYRNEFGGNISASGTKLSFSVTGVPGQQTSLKHFTTGLELCLKILSTKTKSSNMPHSPVS